MNASRRRTILGAVLLASAAAGAYAYYASLVPATHADHDHGILNLDAGGRILVSTRDGKTRNLVGAPGHVLALHFFSSQAPGARDELASLLEFQKRLGPGDTEILLIAKERDFASLDAWLGTNVLVPPVPASLVLDPGGEATEKLNCKRPLETMFFTAGGKLSSQSRGPLDWGNDGAALVERAKSGVTLE